MGAQYLINDYLYLAEHFNRTEYPALFDRYYEDLNSYLTDKAPEDIPVTVAELIEAAESNISRYRLKFRREAALVDSTMMLSLFIIPASIKLNTPAAEALADRLINEWNSLHPESSVKRGSFEEICEGFTWKLF